MYFDAHAHLQNIPDFSATMNRVAQAGVQHILCNAITETDWAKMQQLPQTDVTVHWAFGIHPMAVRHLKPGWDIRLEKHLQQHPTALVGEIGLDAQYPDQQNQIRVFRRQLDLAYAYRRPAVIHCFRAWQPLLAVLKSHQNHLPPKLMSHAHHGDAALIPYLTETCNMYFSYASIFVPDSHPKIQACLKSTPKDRLLIESDAPDLAPTSTILPILTHKMAGLLKHDENDLKKILYNNAHRFIGTFSR